MKKITGRLFIRHESETQYRRWEDVPAEEKKIISECINRQAAYAAGLKEKVQHL